MNEDYPPCPECGYTLCFMERRDWDECPSCGVHIPAELQLDSNFQKILISSVDTVRSFDV